MAKKNVLWIMTDQHRADCLGYMGHPVVKTPHLDSLAKEGVIFEKAFCQSPACMASRASLLTGRYPEAVRVRGMGILPPSETTFPEVLLKNGYRTGLFGKLHLTPEVYTKHQLKKDIPVLYWKIYAKEAGLKPIPEDRFKKNYGFEMDEGCDDALQGRFKKWLKKKTPALLSKKPESLRKDGPGDLWVSPYTSETHQTTYIAEKAAEYIKAKGKGRSPWFTFCSFVAPHHPFEAPKDQIEKYPLKKIPLPAKKGGVEKKFIPYPASMAIGEFDKYSDEVKKLVARHYFASISLVDDGVGRLIKVLKETGQLDNTVIIFTSDHGEFLGNHGMFRKPSLHYDETLNVPLLIRLPKGKNGGRRVKGLVELTDVHPTLLGLLGLPVNDGVQGVDMSENILSGGKIGREDVYTDMFDITPQKFGKLSGPYMAVQTLRTTDWKLSIYPTAGRKYGQLFDLKNDPEESKNLYGNPRYRSKREELLWQLLSRVHRNIDPLPFWLTQY